MSAKIEISKWTVDNGMIVAILKDMKSGKEVAMTMCYQDTLSNTPLGLANLVTQLITSALES